MCTRSITRFTDPDQEAIYQVPVRPCTSLRVASFVFERIILLHSNWLYGVMKSSQFCLKPDEGVSVKWQYSELNLDFVYNFTELHLIISPEQIDKHSISELP